MLFIICFLNFHAAELIVLLDSSGSFSEWGKTFVDKLHDNDICRVF